jgi:hypothetical protein
MQVVLDGVQVLLVNTDSTTGYITWRIFVVVVVDDAAAADDDMICLFVKGAGTRKGNGKCSCDAGYEGDFCDSCAAAYYKAYQDEHKLLCSPCHSSCQGPCTQAGYKGL